MGFSPYERVLPDCRAQLCLFGNAVSPVQAIWILAHLFEQVKVGSGLSPRESIQQHLLQILHERDITWPSPSAGAGTLQLHFEGESISVSFTTTQTVGSLLRAEAALQQEAQQLQLEFEGRCLPDFAFLQERTYQLVKVAGSSRYPCESVPVFVVFLGHMSLYWVPASMTYEAALKWVGIFEPCTLLDETSKSIPRQTLVQAWKQIVVLQTPDSVALDLDLQQIGFGALSDGFHFGSLRTSDSWICTGLWHLDQLVKSNVFLSWIGSGYRSVTVWLPSFAAAVVEGWPHTFDEVLAKWLHKPELTLYAVVFEDWGWNLVKFGVDRHCFQVTFFEAPGHSSTVAAYLSHRAYQVSQRTQFQEIWSHCTLSTESVGSMLRVLQLFDRELGIPFHLAAALHVVAEEQDPAVLASQVSVSPTLPWPREECQDEDVHSPLAHFGRGLSLGFMHSLVKQIFTGTCEFDVKVLTMDSASVPAAVNFQELCVTGRPFFALMLVDKHWVLLHCEATKDNLSLKVYDGLGLHVSSLCHSVSSYLKAAWQVTHVLITHDWILPQKLKHTCGTIALGHLLLLTGVISHEQAMHFEELHDGFVHCDPFQFDVRQVGFGLEDAVTEALAQILPGKGVPSSEVHNRAQMAIMVFGKGPVQKALDARNPWAALKQLGNSRPKPFMWVTHAELQEHIQHRATTKYGAQVDVQRPRKQKDKSSSSTSHQIDPNNLVLPAEVFVTNCGTPVTQVPLAGVVKNARGVAFATASEAYQYVTDGKFISPEGLAILIVGSLPETFPQSLPMHRLRVPAIYKATNEPILIQCTSVQLGDQAVYQKTNIAAPEVAVFPSVVFRAHTFRDLWEHECVWSDLVEHPVRCLVRAFPLLRLCKETDCQGCSQYHPSIEEEGIESGLLDVWGFKWAMHDGSKSQPAKAEVMSVYLRVPESSFDALHIASGHSGVFFEPRQKDSPAPDNRYAVIWIPQTSLVDMAHRVKTHDDCLAVCRLGTKYGVRCLSKNHEALHAMLAPNRPFVKCAVKVIYRLEPLPAGTQRQSLVATLQSFGWVAKPLHPCPSSQGKAWLVGTDVEPPALFIEAQHGWISISKVRDQVTPAQPQDLIATARTKQHIKGASAIPSASTADPWQQGADPWAHYHQPAKATAATPVPSQHVQSKLDEVEQKLQDHVSTTLATQLGQANQEATTRIQTVENQIRSLVDNQSKLQQWIQEGSAQIHELKHDYTQLHTTMQHCTAQGQEHAAAIAGVVTDLGHCNHSLQQQGNALNVVAQDLSGLKESLTQTLDSYFERQADKIESLLSKRQRHD